MCHILPWILAMLYTFDAALAATAVRYSVFAHTFSSPLTIKYWWDW